MKTNIAIFADDGSIIERSIDEMGRTFEILTEIRENYGRSLNKMKSKIMIFNERERCCRGGSGRKSDIPGSVTGK